MELIRLIVLTKSRMKTARQTGVCVTGMVLENKEIVRLVSSEQGDPVFSPFSDKFELLDIIEVQVFKKVPIGPQTENCNVHLKSIKCVDHYNDDIEKLYQDFKACLKEKSYMENEEHKIESADNYHHSLELIKVKNLVLSVNIFEDKEGSGKRGFTTASFEINDNNSDSKYYRYYRVTDKTHELELDSDKVFIGDAVIAVSIPKEPFIDKDGVNQGYFKFIAAIYETEKNSSFPNPTNG